MSGGNAGKRLRSGGSYGKLDRDGFIDHSRMKSQGLPAVIKALEPFLADGPDLEVDETSILVLKGCGPKDYPGMPEVGNMPLPTKLLEKGVKDMVRISDARMSATAFGAVILHVSPEANAGGPSRSLNLQISGAAMEAGLALWRANPPPPVATRSYAKLYIDHVLRTDKGCDLDFPGGASGSVVTRESH